MPWLSSRYSRPMARSHILCVLALIAGSLIFASTARADAPTFAMAKQIGTEYWAKRDVTVPCDMNATLIPAVEWDEMQDHYSDPIYMIADTDTCSAWVSPVADWHRKHGYFFDYCDGIVHEMGPPRRPRPRLRSRHGRRDRLGLRKPAPVEGSQGMAQAASLGP